jgi:hypothetical protein
MSSMETIKEVLSKEGYVSSDEFARDGVQVLALSRIEQYRAEAEYYQKKYGMTFAEYVSSLRTLKGEENFTREADLEDWEFALSALKWWEGKVKELQDA